MSEALPAFQFYRETRLKEVELNGREVEIPAEWEVVELGEVAEIRRGASPRPKGDPKYFGGDIPWIKISDISKYKKGLYLLKTGDTVTEEGKNKSVYCPDGTLIVSNSGTIGEPAIIQTGKGGCIHDGFILVNPADSVDKIFLYYFFEAKKEEFHSKAQRGTQGNMNTKLWKKTKLPLPPLEEQKKIAEVLRSIDEAIQAVEESIAKLERLKKGTMEQLLTKGINHTKFKTVELNGRKVEIPAEWEVVELGEVAERRSETVNPNAVGNLPFVGLEHIEPGNIRLTQWGDSAEVKSSKSKFYPGDVLYGKLRPYLDKAVIAEFEGICSTDIIVIKAKSSKLIPEYLIWLVHTKAFLEHAKKTMKGVNHPRTSWNALKKFQLPLPPLKEQKQIAEILRTIDEAIEAKRAKREKLERMKKAVMEKLLTGEIRVRSDG
ncbi:restriction endonuclease subunit S [Thermococcus sp. 21S7]|uniref:restriction endonuclease subunit S n=1 Tax=Thermococcus sp. 21S7 TaxID=1638221 RepID=UPI00143ABEB6|nr:restriction endonuclease subunit S [Thermococcus sp. 21S7]NJE60525.1 restriction endonuclease subunit S [Thermococcus sp. 21S7]